MGDITNLEHNNRGVEKKKGTQKTDSSENWCWSVLEALYGGLKLAKSEVNKWIYSKIKSDIKCIKSIIENK